MEIIILLYELGVVCLLALFGYRTMLMREKTEPRSMLDFFVALALMIAWPLTVMYIFYIKKKK